MKKFTLPTLYKKSKVGATQEWKIWADQGTIYTEWGQVGGAKQTSQEVCQGKNLGRANCTTAQTQAESQAESKWKKQKDRGYKEDIHSISERIVLPMLANSKAIKRMDKIPFHFPVDVQPKLDGVRCLSLWQGKDVVLLSRKGKPYNLAHLREQLRKLIPNDWVLDGEIYIQGAGLQVLNRLVRPLIPPPESRATQYHIFDVPKSGDEDLTWKQRRVILKSLEELVTKDKFPSIRIVPTYRAPNAVDMWKFHDHFVEKGIEGGIVRQDPTYYEWGHRSSKLFKLKDFDEGEFEVIGYEGGTPGTKEEYAVKWICKTKEGQAFSVRPKGMIEDRIEEMKIADQFVGKMLTVKWQSGQFTEDGKPKYAVGVGFKEDR